MAYVTNTLENQSIVLKTWGRGLKLGNPKIFFPLHGVKIEELGGGIWSILTFIDPFTQKEVKIKRGRGNYTTLNPDDKSPFNRHGIPGFTGFTDPAKRERKKKNTTKQRFDNLTPQGMLKIKHFGGAAVAAGNYTRTKLREEGLVPQILQPVPAGVNATNGQPVFIQNTYAGQYQQLDPVETATRTKDIFGRIQTQLERDLNPYVGAAMNQGTMDTVKQAIADNMIKVTQHEIFKDRLEVNITIPPMNTVEWIDQKVTA